MKMLPHATLASALLITACSKAPPSESAKIREEISDLRARIERLESTKAPRSEFIATPPKPSATPLAPEPAKPPPQPPPKEYTFEDVGLMLKEYWANALVFDRKYKHGDLLRFRGTVSGIDQVNGGFRVGLTSYGGTVYAGRARCTFLASQSNEVMTLSNGTPATISGRYGGMDLSDGSDPTIIVTDAKLIRRPQQ